MDRQEAEIERLRAENEKLRAALNERCPVDAMDQEGMTPAQAAIWHVWGERCSDYEPGCPCCDAWAEYDRLSNASAENEKLRAALRDIATGQVAYLPFIQTVARAALGGKDE